MFHHRRIEDATTWLRIYFADPHSPWQRGRKENTNRLPPSICPREPT
jgi:IS30 family transposase